jgi:hypothetical protein
VLHYRFSPETFGYTRLSFLILDINSKFVTYLKLVYASVQISNIFVFIISSNAIHFVFEIFP